MATAKSKTTAQIVVDVMTGEVQPAGGFSFEKARKMRRDPTINLCRKYSVAPIIASSWTAEGDDQQKEFLEAQFQPIRNAILRTALLSELDFGWKAYELVYGLADFAFSDGRVEQLEMIQRVKPLKNDNTRARYDKESGDFIGLATVDQFTGEKIFIDAEHSLFINFDDEGLGNYAEPAARVAEGSYDQWNDANDAAARYDKKMAGTFLVCEYPVGETPYAKLGGAMTDNSTIAEDALKALTGSGQMCIPKDFKNVDSSLPAELNTWKFYFLEPQAKQGSFVERQKYLDTQKTRAYALPERAIMESEYGTKADATVHGSAALLIRQQHHEDITELINMGPVNLLLRQNWNTEGTAWLKAVPLTDEKAALYKELLLKLMDDQGAGPDIKDKIDVQALLDANGVPVVTETTAASAAALTPTSPPASSAAPSQQTVSISVG